MSAIEYQGHDYRVRDTGWAKPLGRFAGNATGRLPADNPAAQAEIRRFIAATVDPRDRARLIGATKDASPDELINVATLIAQVLIDQPAAKAAGIPDHIRDQFRRGQ